MLGYDAILLSGADQLGLIDWFLSYPHLLRREKAIKKIRGQTRSNIDPEVVKNFIKENTNE
jgi:response regulator RpfG family c-di-GMP phosphodiesterase